MLSVSEFYGPNAGRDDPDTFFEELRVPACGMLGSNLFL